MPALPWKKSKVTRISRLVADLRSTKRGGSLVVETGFPTSLIDLFVKNRDRLKKPKKHKKRVVELEISAPFPSTSPPNYPCNNLIVSTAPALAEGAKTVRPPLNTEEKSRCKKAEELVVVGENFDRVEDCVGGSKVEGVLAAILKMFVVVVLALSTKKLAVVITMSAFALLFLEYVGNRAGCLLKPCSVAQTVLRSLIQRVSLFLWPKKDALVSFEIGNSDSEGPEETKICQENSVVVADPIGSVGTFELSSRIHTEEIEIVENKFEVISRGEETTSVEPDIDIDKLSRDKRWGCLDMDGEENRGEEEVRTNRRNPSTKMKGKTMVVEEDEDGGEEEVLEGKNRCSKRAKLKAKIVKIFVSKKSRDSKKGKKSEGREPELISGHVPSSLGEDKLSRCDCEESVEHDDSEKQEPEDEENKLWPLPLPLEEEKERCQKLEELNDGISCQDKLVQVNEGVGEKVGGLREGKSGYLVLFLIVLAGLVGGRILAFMLTITWYLMLKSLGRFRRSTNCPMIRSPVTISR